MPRFGEARFYKWLRGFVGNDRLILSILAIAIGAAGGGAVIGLWEGIALVQGAFFGSRSHYLYQHASQLAWWHLLLAPAAGGLLIGLLVHRFLPGRRPHGVADVIEASAVGDGRMSAASGLKAAAISAASIGVGASVGREGPAVHLGAALAGWLAGRLNLNRSGARTLLGCGVSAAVAASFNAPIAGALFATEVVVGHYALKAFAPIVIASITGAAISRAYFQGALAFAVPEHTISSFLELPAFAGLGILAGVMAVVFMRSIHLAGRAADKVPGPVWLRPAIAGLAVGAMAVWFPQVLGVGYGTTESALTGAFSLPQLVAIAVAKVAATAICLGFGFGGGVFSPSLVIGALFGGAYGLVASEAFPLLASEASAYAVVGMGAMAAAVLGAPVSTTLIIFEMTGDYTLTVAVLLAVVLASLISQQAFGRSFFLSQLKHRGLDLEGGAEAALMRTIKVIDVMNRDVETVPPGAGLAEIREKLGKSPAGKIFAVGGNGDLLGDVTLAGLGEAAFDTGLDGLVVALDAARPDPPALAPGDDLETARDLMADCAEDHVAVVADSQSMTFLGCLSERDLMAAYNRALIESRREERGE